MNLTFHCFTFKDDNSDKDDDDNDDAKPIAEEQHNFKPYSKERQ